MADRYLYPDNLRAKVAARRTRRVLVLWTAFLAALALAIAAASLHLGPHPIAWLCLPVFFLNLLIIEKIAFRRLQAQLLTFLEVDGAMLRQVAPGGGVLSEINLAEPYDVQPAHKRGVPILRVRQRDRCVEFSTTIDNGRMLVEDILGKRWLPDFEYSGA